MDAPELFTAGNGSPPLEAGEASIPRLFEAQVERTPEAVAVVAGDTQLTYRALDHQATQLAHSLRRLGVGPEVRVGVCLERSPLLVATLLGVLKAGGAYVPLDPAYPSERLAFMLSDSKARVLLTQSHLLDRLPVTPNLQPLARTPNIICLDTDWPTIAQSLTPGANLLPLITADNLAYVIYTSGSTGTPKGVLGLHQGAINRFRWMWQAYPFEPGERCCQKTALSFVDSVWEIFGPLLQGVPLVILPDEVVKDPNQLLQTLAEQRVTRIVLVPSLLRALLAAQPGRQSLLPKLKYCVSSGEALPTDLCQQFQHRLPHCTLLNLYGSSEVAADATCYDTRDWSTHGPVPIGRPIDNLQTYVLDTRLQTVPVGEPGELYVGGAGLARGYLDRPELTAERFVPNPFLKDDGARRGQKADRGTTFSLPPSAFRLYKTGDLARYRPDGSLEFLGRSDHQVKIRGVRVELGEIETALAQHANVQATVVVARDDSQREKRLVAYIVPEREPAPSSSELRRFLRLHLPETAIPAVFIMLRALPLTPNGKVDRRALPALDQLKPETESAYAPPRSAIEETLCQIWAEVLGLQRVGLHDNFFDLGGYSLKATQVMSRVREAFHVDLPPLNSLFEAPTVAELAGLITRQQIEHTDAATLEQLLAEVEQLSPDEALELLSAEKQSRPLNDYDARDVKPQGVLQ